MSVRLCADHYDGLRPTCPSWCTAHINDGTDDLHRWEGNFLGSSVTIEIEQARDYDAPERWRDPVVFIATMDNRFAGDEVREVAGEMAAAAALLERLERCSSCGLAVEVRVSAAGCPAWCTDHDLLFGHPDDEVHRRVFGARGIDASVEITQHVRDPEPDPQLHFEVAGTGAEQARGAAALLLSAASVMNHLLEQRA